MAGKIISILWLLVFFVQAPQLPATSSPSVGTPGTVRIFIEEDYSMAQALRKELNEWAAKIGLTLIFTEKENRSYDLRLLLASETASASDNCSVYNDCSSPATCTTHTTIQFVSAVAITKDGTLRFTETGVGTGRKSPISPLARKIAKRLSVLSM